MHDRYTNTKDKFPTDILRENLRWCDITNKNCFLSALHVSFKNI